MGASRDWFIQKYLAAVGYSVAIDGDYGPKTEAAVRAYQSANGLASDGIAGPETYSSLEQAADARVITPREIEAAADILDVEAASIHAVTQVESIGNGFLSDGRPVILYERHIMRRQMLKNGFSTARVAALCQGRSNLVNKRYGGYSHGSSEHDRLAAAREIDETSALESCSWGLFQIMGFHWQRLGYASVQEMVGEMERSEDAHLSSFVRFIKSDWDLHKALRAKNWAGFARIYNGPAYARNSYDTRLARAYTDNA